jgi:hypothetical protein
MRCRKADRANLLQGWDRRPLSEPMGAASPRWSDGRGMLDACCLSEGGSVTECAAPRQRGDKQDGAGTQSHPGHKQGAPQDPPAECPQGEP